MAKAKKKKKSGKKKSAKMAKSKPKVCEYC